MSHPVNDDLNDRIRELTEQLAEAEKKVELLKGLLAKVYFEVKSILEG